MTDRSILVAGGYGVVGQRIAADLAPDYPVIVAGRHLAQAQATAAAIGYGARGRELDVTVAASIAAALEDVAIVVSCNDQPRRGPGSRRARRVRNGNRPRHFERDSSCARGHTRRCG